MKKTILVLLLLTVLISFGQNPERFYQGGKVGYKLNGQTIIDPIYDCGSDYYEGFALVCQNGKFGFLTDKGAQLGFLEFEHAGVFRQGLAKVKKNGKYGFINTQGEIVIEYQFEYVTDFSDSVAGAQKNGKWALLSVDGHLITDFTYDFIIQGSEGKIGAKKDDLWGFLDSNGKIALPFNYSMIQPFIKGVSIVGIKDEDGIDRWKIDHSGTLLEKLENEEAEREREEKKR